MLSANTTTVQILRETENALLVKCLYFTTTANDEVDVLKVNTETLLYRTYVLNGSAVTLQPSGWMPGELVTGETSGATGRVTEYIAASNALSIVNMTGAFQAAETVKGGYSNSTMVLAASNTVYTPVRILKLDAIWWSVAAANAGYVELEYANTTAKSTLLTLSSTGNYGEIRPYHPIPNLTTNAIGNLYVSTHRFAANDSYTLIMELRKLDGFGAVDITGI